MAIAPTARAPSSPAQKPTNRPNEKGKKSRSPGPSPAARNTKAHERAHQLQDASVSSQRIGGPVVPEVWKTRT